MTLEKFLESKPELVKKIDACKSEEEIIKVIKAEVSDKELANLEIPNIEKMSLEDIANISGGDYGGKYADKAFSLAFSALVKAGEIVIAPVRGIGKSVLGFMVESDMMSSVTGMATIASLGYIVSKCFLQSKDKKQKAPKFPTVTVKYN